MESKELTVVIVTFKSEGKIFNCLDSIPNNIKVKIVENSNNEKFKSSIENKYQNVQCILTGSNKGYAVANNVGLNNVNTEYALVLNPDTILQENAINNFFITSKKYKDFWLIGPASDQKIKKDFKKNHALEVDNLKGFAIFFNMKKFNKNFFDEKYFLYFEEIDLCRNVKKNNGKIYLDKNIVIRHEGASSVEKTKQYELEKSRNWHWMWSTFYFHKKHYGYISALSKILPQFISSLFKFIFNFVLLNKSKSDIYRFRLLGIINSILLKKSSYRPKI